ncbi:hypothetical protein N0V85_006758 [Neurospora sp. IMI 360204]|nr:hypothetical protein N0V85_006758 [Neurospora sp. IMI 360204]
MPVWASVLDVSFINNKPRSHKPSLDRKPLPTYEEVMQMTRVKKETLNTPLSKFAPTGIHIGAIILGPDRWREIGQWVVESGSMQMPSMSKKLDDDQVRNKPADVESAIFENVRLDETVVPEDSVTKWDGDDDAGLDEWEVDLFQEEAARDSKEKLPVTARLDFASGGKGDPEARARKYL